MKWLMSILLLMIVHMSWGATCSIRASRVRFLNYDPFTSNSDFLPGKIRYRCRHHTGSISKISILLSTGVAGSYQPREMFGSFGQRLAYNLYLDQNCETIWGNGTGNSRIYQSSSPIRSNKWYVVPVYGCIPPGQNVEPGKFYDFITALVTIYY